MKIAILSRPDYRSPRILAESLKYQLKNVGINADIFHNIDVLARLYSYQEQAHRYKYHFWLRKKFQSFFQDHLFLKKLKQYDAIVICECTPNGFWKDHYNIEKLKNITGKPVLYYEVYYLGNAPTQIDQLLAKSDPTIERYDYHLAVTDTTEINNAKGPWSCIGLDLRNTGLIPNTKDEFIVLVDFAQAGYESHREDQLEVLNELGIKYIALSGEYTTTEIRAIYNKSSVILLQFPEAFGLPIAECLTAGVQIFTSSSSWPMSWRLDENPQIHQEGKLPDIFTVYHSRNDLINKLIAFQTNYDLLNTPKEVFEKFIDYYPHFYEGNKVELMKVLELIERKSIK
ncbi:hypothetical protein [Pontibacter liquoris]|uniref:hypothetical protein n=1 Tax=Pontibacter liquoris TaxID=2905677 RepID=UPI001FA6AD35|nr:hypothetical protein [Pontibacter liquoris]